MDDIRIGARVTAWSPESREDVAGYIESGHAGWWDIRTTWGELTGPWDARWIETAYWHELKDFYVKHLEGQGFTRLSICTCCLFILVNGDHSSCDDECPATHGYGVGWEGWHITPGGGMDEHDSGELGHCTSSCDLCGQRDHGDRHEAWARQEGQDHGIRQD